MHACWLSRGREKYSQLLLYTSDAGSLAFLLSPPPFNCTFSTRVLRINKLPLTGHRYEHAGHGCEVREGDKGLYHCRRARGEVVVLRGARARTARAVAGGCCSSR